MIRTARRRKLWRWLLGACALGIAPVALYFVMALVFGYWSQANVKLPVLASEARSIRIFVRSNGVHTDIVLPVRLGTWDWHQALPMSAFKTDVTNLDHVAFGWGDRGFYLNVPTWAELNVLTGLRAMSGQGPAAIHVTFLAQPQESELLQAVMISPAQYASIARHVSETFDRSVTGEVQQIPSPWQESHDALFAAHGAYSPLRTCNEWTREAFVKAGLRTARWAVFPFAIFTHLDTPS
jgi:uncharacterized protein (TIGR02117 family)